VFGSDAPVASASPFAAIAVAETRRDAQGRPEGGFQPAHRLSRAVALRAYTLGNAKVLGAPWLGRIRTGACADLLWVQAPFHTITPEALRTLKPGRLWVDGREQTLD
jgi:predicted amidohydrolase YtcJ